MTKTIDSIVLFFVLFSTSIASSETESGGGGGQEVVGDYLRCQRWHCLGYRWPTKRSSRLASLCLYLIDRTNQLQLNRPLQLERHILIGNQITNKSGRISQFSLAALTVGAVTRRGSAIPSRSEGYATSLAIVVQSPPLPPPPLLHFYGRVTDTRHQGGWHKQITSATPTSGSLVTIH